LLPFQLLRRDSRGESQFQTQGVPDGNDARKARHGVSAGADPLHSRARDPTPLSQELVTQPELLSPSLKHAGVEWDRSHDPSPRPAYLNTGKRPSVGPLSDDRIHPKITGNYVVSDTKRKQRPEKRLETREKRSCLNLLPDRHLRASVGATPCQRTTCSILKKTRYSSRFSGRCQKNHPRQDLLLRARMPPDRRPAHDRLAEVPRPRR